jgi:hypothetical protein
MRLLALFAIPACDRGPEANGCEPGDDPQLTIGLGVGGYSPIPDQGEFPLVHGPQGGYHLEIGLEATGIDASQLITGHMEGTIAGEQLAVNDPWLEFLCEGGVLHSWGTRLIYDSTPEILDGKVTLVEASVTDLQGTLVSTSATYTIRDDP